ncbi:hypothetical protein P3T36_004664 [Kitasatospora sp. MAP12-15]|uniref:hypothetical protein n=1 Tax=unclassified Kitasatospora TaxID=2633591 RepID=UPI002474BB1B|nr:hypothetical protein [Kitasatospora sp. MAP12-44]MDH6111510.1 hypothetical protein [Kitasatospora sp. MAP12-44]
MRLEASLRDRTFAVETLSAPDAAQRDHVARLRRDHGFPLPAPDWETLDEEGVVLLCRVDGVPAGSVRLIRRQVGADDQCPYFTPELEAALPRDPAGFVFCERLVVSPGSRSLGALAMVMHAAATWSTAWWPVTEFAAITRPQLVRLAHWLGARQLSRPMALPGSDGLGLLIGGRLEEAAQRTEELFTTAGWQLSTRTARHATPGLPTARRATAEANTDRVAAATRAVVDGRVQLTSRTLDEYRLVFGLTDPDLLSGPVLDCPGGASSFAAESRALGADVTAADPVYSLSPEDIGALVHDHLAVSAAFGLAIADQLDFSWAGSPERHLERWQCATATFLRDYTEDHPNSAGRRYVPAALPHLPFADRQFRLTLCGFLLFTFPDAADQEAAIHELVRVTDGDVLVGPLEDPLGSAFLDLDLLRGRLSDAGVTTTVRDIGYSIHPRQRGVLVCRRTG